MPDAKSGTAGTVVSPTDPTDAQDALDGQAGTTEDSPSQGTDRGTQTFSATSVTADAEQLVEASEDDSEDDNDTTA